ncbi:hypothetical protein BO94DRAFT_571631 [Aspergillus sclerotioniger CBS 115572]|uniref:TPR-like protein n=1 Tax=Aspergillus sclerotioniger CBS 115572 TaxID=1450535 RepID=A0A317X8R2_9EURO|nr:hypothetical protein BO94DRAFT_571631 [Aspergillus sclerotioniger CBS 115572]PWY94986.1 hypothetical protein BO94DRAFT_571631 [Aspergillus sclerotioniger CBS 115572]
MGDPASVTDLNDVKLQAVFASIPEAFKLHGIWQPDDEASDDDSFDDECMFSGTDSDDYDEEDENGSDGNNGQSDGEGGDEADKPKREANEDDNMEEVNKLDVSEAGDNEDGNMEEGDGVDVSEPEENEDGNNEEGDGIRMTEADENEDGNDEADEIDIPEAEQNENGENAQGDATDNQDQDNLSIPLFTVGFNHSLLRETELNDQDPDNCPNGIVRPDMWAARPRLHLEGQGMGFLSQLAQLCVRSRLAHCRTPKCMETRDAMAKWAPCCNWVNFREWALVAMSCQAAMDDHQTRSRAHTHLARSATGCFSILKRFRDKNRYILPFLDGEDGDQSCTIELSEVFNLIYWMAGIQSQLGTGSADFSRWDHDFLPIRYTVRTVQAAAKELGDMDLCKNRVWNLVNVSDRKHGDLPDIVTAIARHGESLSHAGHQKCTPSKCQGAQMDSTKVGQLHKCTEPVNCAQTLFPVELLLTNLELGKRTAWLCETRRLCSSSDSYIALSHVWSDGTGVGVQDAGSVNSCLFNFFADIAAQLGCKGIWWDTLSIPYEPKARSKALSVMHGNYANASHTVVHDRFLLNFPWSEDGGPCLALVLSTWFTRGWTALELAMSKSVKVLFKDPGSGKPVIKDLDEHILARSPRAASRAHWLATSMIERLRRPIDNIGDLVTILAPRSTSWVRDRTIIASLLAGVPDPDLSKGESEMTRDILRYLGKIPYASLLHGKSTMYDNGGYSWSPATLDDLPVEAHGDCRSTDDTIQTTMLEIDDAGAVWGLWSFREVVESDIVEGNIEPYGDDLAATLRVQMALEEWDKHILLLPSLSGSSAKALLVVPLAILKDGPTIKCRYVGSVLVKHNEDTRGLWTVQNIQLGGQDKQSQSLRAGEVWNYLSSIDENTVFQNDEMVVKDAPEEPPTPNETPMTPEPLGEWLNGNTEDPSVWLANSGVAQASYAAADLSPEALVQALEVNNRSATRVLIKNNILIDPADVKFPLDQNTTNAQKRKDEKLARGLTLLGDVYAERSLLDRAIKTYTFILKGPWAQRIANQKNQNNLAFLDIQLAWGQAVMALQHSLSSNEVANYSQSVQSAENIFKNILKACEENGNYRAVEVKKKGREPTRGPSTSNATADRSSEKVNAPSDASSQDRRGDERKAIQWLQLELNAISEMVALAASRYDFATATKQLRRAMAHFGKPVEVFEAFKPRWPERRTQDTASKKERDEAVAAVYQRALRRLTSILKKHHPLLLVIRLQLGVNYTLQSKFKQAETQLNQVLSGLTSHDQPSIQNSNTHDSFAAFKDHHVLVALTRYHLGKAYLEQDRFDHARDHFTEALNVTPFGRPECNELHYTIALALCRSHIERDDKDIGEAVNLALSVIETYQTEEAELGLDWRLVVEAHWSIARALHAAGGSENTNNAISICEYTLKLAQEQQFFDEQGDLDETDLLSLYASLHEDAKLYEKAEDLRQTVSGIVSRLEGCSSLPHLKSQFTLAKTRQMAGDALKATGNRDEAENKFAQSIEGFEAALKGFQEVLGGYATRTLRTCQALGGLHLALGKMEKAREYYARAYQGYQKRYGTAKRVTAMAAYDLGTAYYQSCKFTDAKTMFLTAYKGYMEDFKRKKKFHKAITTATIDLAETCAALGGPDYEGQAERYYNQALEDLQKYGAEKAGQDILRVELKKGNLYRQQKRFEDATLLIEKAYNHFCPRDSGQEDAVDPVDNTPGPSDSVVRWEAMLRLAELLLDCQQADFKCHEDDQNPEDLVQVAKAGLEETVGGSHLFTLQAAVLLGEICLQDDCPGGCPGETELEQAVKLCRDVLPPGSPMTIKAMDCLITHWTKNTHQTGEADAMTKVKWQALKDGYGIDTAVAIMKMTDPKRENLMWNLEAPEDDDDFVEEDILEGGIGENNEGDIDSSSDDGDLDSLSSDEELDFWGQEEEEQPRGFGQPYIMPQQYSTMVDGAEAVMVQPDGSQFQYQPQTQYYVAQPQFIPDPPPMQDSIASILQTTAEIPFHLLQGFITGVTAPLQ